jgi:hypothetical protein
MAEFIDCTSVKISYDVMGRVTVSYTIVSDESGMKAYTTVSFGGRTFTGYVVSITLNQIPNTSWYENYVTLIATTD